MGRLTAWSRGAASLCILAMAACSSEGATTSTEPSAPGVEYSVVNRCGFTSDLFITILDSDPIDPADARPISLGNGDSHVYRTRDDEPTARFLVDLVDPTAAMSGAAVETDEDGIPIVVDTRSAEVVLGPDRSCPGFP